ncbi:hypothetical protein DU475_17110 [Rhodopseudomonas sp. WA056]|uniref:hypothetical protein n=1 Tax=Rhodopseudomonas TaxID=1073 RepID=UPI00115F320A|nr:MULTISPECIES: hypothetical protein [Rhodopseudomonas]NEW88974.1 hypothetical protein [Rhodopseudomonas sp. WA056]QDL99430.1 hypothetical protein FLL57_19885 [Rhodopseudomonas palustris]
MRVLKYETGAALLTAAALLTWSAATPAQAMTAQECSAKYQAAKADGTLDGQGWNDFRKAHCGAAAASGDSAAAEAKPSDAKPANAKPETKPDAKSDAKSGAKPESKSRAKAAAAPAVQQGPAVYPTAIDAKFAQEKPTRARLHTCAQQWKANKAANTTGGLRWIQKGGGYWSECNKRLKG